MLFEEETMENMENLENIFDIRKKEKLMYVLPKDVTTFELEDELTSSVAVAVNLYYEEMSDFFFSYLTAIPEKIQIYIISSKQVILDAASVYFQGKKNVILLKKDNRGRDISALLVVFREIALRYRYICFVHDKKTKHGFLEKDVNLWIRNLWENTLSSREYISNVLKTFENTEKMGLLAPPEPMGEYIRYWAINTWYENYKHACDLAAELQLKCNMDEEKPPITLGTVFWARTDALKKLLIKEWSYTDFPDEPLPEDGTISHAIERIMGYVVQDAGYKTGTVMTNEYAESMLLFLQDSMMQINNVLDSKLHIHSIHQMKQLDNQRTQITQFFAQYKKIYLYGAGGYGQELLESIRAWGFEPAGFIVSDGQKNCDSLNNVPIYELQEIAPSHETGIIISVRYKLQKDIEETLQMCGHKNYIMGYP